MAKNYTWVVYEATIDNMPSALQKWYNSIEIKFMSENP